MGGRVQVQGLVCHWKEKHHQRGGMGLARDTLLMLQTFISSSLLTYVVLCELLPRCQLLKVQFFCSISSICCRENCNLCSLYKSPPSIPLICRIRGLGTTG
jgi:hypothetical protein